VSSIADREGERSPGIWGWMISPPCEARGERASLPIRQTPHSRYSGVGGDSIPGLTDVGLRGDTVIFGMEVLEGEAPETFDAPAPCIDAYPTAVNSRSTH
jgi:hypothetical protein